MNHRFSAERGATAIIVAAVILPIAMLLFAGLLDLSRAPLSRYGLKTALFQALQDIEQELPLVTGNAMIQEALPAANNLKTHIASPASAEDTLMSASGMLNPQNAKSILSAACAAAGRRMNDSFSSLIFMNYSDSPTWAFQFAIAQIATSGKSYSTLDHLEDDSACYSTKNFSALAGEADITWLDILKTFTKHIGTDTDGTMKSSWPLQNDYADSKSESAGSSPLPSIWLVGVAHMQLDNMLGKFFSEKPRIISTWYMRPLGAPAGIQASWYKESEWALEEP